jgi:hypothetical protein
LYEELADRHQSSATCAASLESMKSGMGGGSSDVKDSISATVTCQATRGLGCICSGHENNAVAEVHLRGLSTHVTLPRHVWRVCTPMALSKRCHRQAAKRCRTNAQACNPQAATPICAGAHGADPKLPPRWAQRPLAAPRAGAGGSCGRAPHRARAGSIAAGTGHPRAPRHSTCLAILQLTIQRANEGVSWSEVARSRMASTTSSGGHTWAMACFCFFGKRRHSRRTVHL